MRKLFRTASRALALAALAFLLVANPKGNAENHRQGKQSKPSETTKVSRLTAALKDRSYWPDQCRAADALGELGPAAQDAVPALVAALRDSEFLVRHAAAHALGKIGIFSPQALAALKRAAKDEDPSVQDAARESYETLLNRATKVDVPALIAGLTDSDPLVRQVAAGTLDKVGAISASPKVMSALKAALEDKDPEVRRLATGALGKVVAISASPDVLAILKTLMENKDPEVRRLTIRALGKADAVSPEALASLKAVLKDNDPDVRRAATEEYERAYKRVMDYPTPDHVPTLIAALKDGKPSVRRDAAGALAKVGAIAASPDVMAALKAATKDKEADVRRAATATWERIPLIEAYLLQGRYAAAEAALVAHLKETPSDDQARFGLGVLRFVHGIERLGQSLHKYGCKSEKTNIPFLRLPVSNNPNPDPILYTDLRRLLDNFGRDLSAAETALADITDDNVKLPLHLAAIRLDLVGDGKSTTQLIDILKKIMQRRQFDFQKSNPDLLVCFDRGDAAWLRAYCHLLMGMLDLYLAFDSEMWFDLFAGELFAKPKNRVAGEGAERWQKMLEAGKLEIALQERDRLGKFRKHLLKVGELNRETWKHIRAERDDDHEWLPNAKQTGVVGLPVHNEMIDTWLIMVAELEALLNGERTLTYEGLGKDFVKDGKGLNLKALLEDPPAKFLLQDGFPRTLPDKYFSERKDLKNDVLSPVLQLFDDPTALTYAVWFN